MFISKYIPTLGLGLGLGLGLAFTPPRGHKYRPQQFFICPWVSSSEVHPSP